MKDLKVTLLHCILDIETIEDLVMNKDFNEFKGEEETKKAVHNLLDKLEAQAKEITEKLPVYFPHYNWQNLVEEKKKELAHHSSTDYHSFWSIIQYELPEIKSHFEKLHEKIEAEEKNRHL